MNYKKIYNRIVENALNREIPETYTEKHHIIPKCLGGSDDCSNIAILTCREHIICHILLAKIYPHNYKILYAMTAMTMNANGNRTVTARQLAFSRESLIKAASMRPPTRGMLGKRHTKESIEKISNNTRKAMLGMKQSKSHIENKAITKRKPVMKVDIKTGDSVIFQSIAQASREGFKPSAISRCCNGKNKTHKGFYWSFTDKP